MTSMGSGLVSAPPPGPPGAAAFAAAVRDLAEVRRTARAAGVPLPEGLVLEDEDAAHVALEAFGVLVLRPRTGPASRGITVCRDRAGLTAWLRGRFLPGRYVAEAFVEGPVRRIHALVHGGRVREWEVLSDVGDTGACARGLPRSAATVPGARLRAAAGALLDGVVRGWRIDSAVLRAEVFEQQDRLLLRGLRAGPGGTGAVRAVAATRGIDLGRAAVLAPGEDPDGLRGRPAAANAGYTVHFRRPGRLLAYDDSAVAALAHHREVTARPGTLLGAAVVPRALSTHVFTADRPADLRALLARAEGAVRVSVARDTGPCGA